jgi:hypothetical protein
MIIKIDDCKIEYQPNTKIFYWDRDNLIESESKPIIKLNSQLTQYL